MKARRVAILCINPWNSIVAEFQPFSYAAYRIQAALVADPRFAETEVRLFEGRGWDVERWVAELADFDPDVIGGSAYVWSLPMFVPVLRRLKAMRPDLWSILGGPAARIELLEHEPYRDTVEFIQAMVTGMGEGTMNDVVCAWPDGSLAEIPGLAVVDGDRWRATAPVSQKVDANAIASPFQLGLAPDGKSAHLQTFMGCPMSCTFCAWGLGDGHSGVYSAEYLTRELTAFKEANANAVMSVDAGLNLNSHAYRNLMEAESRVGFFQEVPFHVECYPSRVDDSMLEFFSGLKLAEVGVGLQSYDPDVTKLSKRQFKVANFERVIHRLSQVSRLKIELIMGLPGDTPDNFRRSVERVLELPCNLIQVFHCLVLPDALMSQAANMGLVYDPISLQLIERPGWTEDDFLRLSEWLDGLVAARNGLATFQWPKQNTDRSMRGTMGKIPGAPMWVIPNRL